MRPVVETTDVVFGLALIALVAWVRSALSGELGRRARVQLARPVGTFVAALLVGAIAVVAIADSVRIPLAHGRRTSLLDEGLARLVTGSERGYSAPLATTLLQPALHISGDGRPERTRERLEHVQPAGVLAHPFALGSAGALSGLCLATLLVPLGFRRRHVVAAGAFLAFVGASLALASEYHLLGTDKVGQDILLRCLKGCRTASVIGFVGSVFAGGVALLTAGLSALGGRWADDATHFVWSVVAAVPFILAVAVLQMIEPAALGADGHLLSLALILGTFAAPPLHRVARAELLRAREAHYVTTAAALGLGGAAILRTHLLPGVLHVFLRTFGVRVALLVLTEPVLTFVGLGMHAYSECGADCVFIPGIHRDPSALRTLVTESTVPLNVLLEPGGPSLNELWDMGATRVSCGTTLLRVAYSALVEAGKEMLARGRVSLDDHGLTNPELHALWGVAPYPPPRPSRVSAKGKTRKQPERRETARARPAAPGRRTR